MVFGCVLESFGSGCCPSVDEILAAIRGGKFLDNVYGFTGMPRGVLPLGQLRFIHSMPNRTAASVVRAPFLNSLMFWD